MSASISKFSLFVILAALSFTVSAEGGKAKNDLVLEYLDYVGVVDSIELQVETMFLEYRDFYPNFSKEFWEDPRVIALFDDYRVSLLRGYAEAMEDGLSAEELEFLVDFYSSEKGKKVVALGKRLDPLTIAAAADAGKEFSAGFASLVEGNAN